jgi:hypothetical protein
VRFSSFDRLRMRTVGFAPNQEFLVLSLSKGEDRSMIADYGTARTERRRTP